MSDEAAPPLALSPELVDFMRQEAQLLKIRLDSLIAHGFTRAEAFRIILAAVRSEPIFRPPQGADRP